MFLIRFSFHVSTAPSMYKWVRKMPRHKKIHLFLVHYIKKKITQRYVSLDMC